MTAAAPLPGGKGKAGCKTDWISGETSVIVDFLPHILVLPAFFSSEIGAGLQERWRPGFAFRLFLQICIESKREGEGRKIMCNVKNNREKLILNLGVYYTQHDKENLKTIFLVDDYYIVFACYYFFVKQKNSRRKKSRKREPNIQDGGKNIICNRVTYSLRDAMAYIQDSAMIDDEELAMFLVDSSSTEKEEDARRQSLPKKVSTDLLRWFYSTTYPLESLWRMLNCDNNVQHREFAFTFIDRRSIVGDTTTKEEEEERMQRHMSFADFKAFAAYVRYRKPCRIDIGGAYLIKPHLGRLYACDHAGITSEVGYKELTFDIDIDGYDAQPKRTCCSGRDWCKSCWPIVNVGCVAMDISLRHMDAKSIGWFFSGGRGMHCWVMDPSMCDVDTAARTMVARRVAFPHKESDLFLRVFEECCDPTCTEIVHLFVLPPEEKSSGSSSSSVRDYCFCKEKGTNYCCPMHEKNGFFLGWYAKRHPDVALATVSSKLAALRAASIESKTVPKQDITELERELERIQPDVKASAAALCEMRQLCGKSIDVHLDTLRDGWNKGDPLLDSVDRVCALLAGLAAKVRESRMAKFERKKSHENFCDAQVTRAIIMAAVDCLAPRTDLPVTVQTTHLLKAPLSIHPLTGLLAVPMQDRRMLAKFLPSDAPSVPVACTYRYHENIGQCIDEVSGRPPLFDDPHKAKQAVAAFEEWTNTLQ